MDTTSRRYQATIRQYDLVDSKILKTPITIVGAGAVGSWTTLALAKMGFEHIRVYDFDTVEIENMAGQLYGFRDIGVPKVEALAKMVEELTEIKISTVVEKFGNSSCLGVVVPAVDSMSARKEIYECQTKDCQWFIDPRMGAEIAVIYTINPSSSADSAFYEKTLHTDEEAVPAPCTAKSTTYCSLVLSGLVAKTVANTLMGNKYMRNMSLSLKDNDFIAFSAQTKTE